MLKYISIILLSLVLFATSTKTLAEERIFGKNQSIPQKYFHSDRIVVKIIPEEEVPSIETTPITEKLKKLIGAKEFKKSISIKIENTKFEKIGLERVFTFYFASEVDVFEKINIAENSGLVEFAEPKYKRYFSEFTPNDTRYGEIKKLLSTVNMEQAWELSTGSPNVKIAIIDSGTDIEHKDLDGNLYINPNEIPNNGIDDDENGLIDDVSGWDLIGDISSNEAAAELWEPDNNPRPRVATNNHGTHVTGIASAEGNNQEGIIGTAFGCTFIPIKAAADDYLNFDEEVGQILRTDEALIIAAEMGADIINCSWGGLGYSQVTQDIVRVINDDYGVLIVAAAGNESLNNDDKPYYPANYAQVLSVGASSDSGFRSPASNFGSSVDVFAPGVSYLSTEHSNRYAKRSGTSMATPVVAGIAALLKSEKPSLTPEIIKLFLTETAADINDDIFPSKRVDAFAALNSLIGDGEKIYKLEITDVKILAPHIDSVFRSEGNFILRFEIKNLAHSLENAMLTISSSEQFINVNRTAVDAEFQEFGGEFEAEFGLTINDLNPWFLNFNRFQLHFDSEVYSDSIPFTLPQSIPNENTFVDLVSFARDEGLIFYSSDVADSTVWMAGYTEVFESGIAFRHRSNGANGVNHSFVYPDSTIAICGINTNHAYVIARKKSGEHIIYYLLGNEIAASDFFSFSVAEPITIQKDKNNIAKLFVKIGNSLSILELNAASVSQFATLPIDIDFNENAIEFTQEKLYIGTKSGEIVVLDLFSKEHEVIEDFSSAGELIDMTVSGDTNKLIILQNRENPKLTVLDLSSLSEMVSYSQFDEFEYTPNRVLAEPETRRTIILDENGRVYSFENYELPFRFSRILSVNRNQIFNSEIRKYGKNNTALILLSRDLSALIFEQFVDDTVSVRDISNSDILIYPNPVQNQLNIDLKSVDYRPNNIEITDLNGRILERIFIKEEDILTINTSNLSSGAYFLVFNSQRESLFHKFIKR